MKPILAFADNHQAAVAIRDFGASACAQVRGLTLLPYAFMSPEFTVWWLVPGPHPSNPAYRHGKGFISLVKDGPGAGSAYVGFYVEKAFAQAEAKALQLPLVQLMDDTWCWHSVSTSGRTGELDRAVDMVRSASQEPVVVTVAVSEPNRPPDQRGARGPADEVVFEASGAGALHLETGAHGVLSPLETSPSLRDLFARIAALDALRFYWIDFMVGVRLQYGTAGPGAWGGPEVWQRTMAPWVKWLK